MSVDWNRAVWVYDDSVMIAPMAKLTTDDGSVIKLWDEILKVKLSVIIRANKGMITISRGTWDAILVWANTQYGGLELNDYLNRMFAKCP